MTLELKIINPVTHHSWDEVLLSHPGYSFFNSSYWARVLSDSYGYNPLYFSLIAGNKLVAMIPVMEIQSVLTGRRGISLPFSDYSRPIATDSNQFLEMVNSIIQYGREAGWKYFELRGGDEFYKESIPYATHYGHILDLTPAENEIFSAFRSDTQRNIRKAIKLGVKVTLDNTMQSLDQFYRLNCMTRKDHGIPPQPYQFFKNIYEHVLAQAKGFVALASYDNVLVAGAVFFHLGQRAVYKYGASDTTFKHLALNKLVMWEAISWYRRNGYQSLCLGRTELENHGLRSYKIGWGTSESVINYYKLDVKTGDYMSGDKKNDGWLKNVYRKVPIPISKVIGAVLYRHIG